jgi:predicted anti-sigma-YlaC factor YlaD
MDNHQIKSLLHLLSITRDRELDCNEFLAAVPEVAECALAGKPVPVSIQLVEHHLALCAECREEYVTLLAALRMKGGTPQ